MREIIHPFSRKRCREDGNLVCLIGGRFVSSGEAWFSLVSPLRRPSRVSCLSIMMLLKYFLSTFNWRAPQRYWCYSSSSVASATNWHHWIDTLFSVWLLHAIFKSPSSLISYNKTKYYFVILKGTYYNLCYFSSCNSVENVLKPKDMHPLRQTHRSWTAWQA